MQLHFPESCKLAFPSVERRNQIRIPIGILKLGTTWPLPPKLLEKYLSATDKILIVEEVIPFLEDNVKILAAELAAKVGIKRFHGKRDGSVPSTGKLNPDAVRAALYFLLAIVI